MSLDLLLSRRVLFFGGKGGVGKTTCASATALAASRRGRRVLLVSTDPAHSTADVFQQLLGPEERELQPSLWGLEIDGAAEARRYVEDVKAQVRQLFSPGIYRQASQQIDLAATMPGVEEVALFDRVSRLVTERGDAAYDLVVFDTAPTGHTLRLLRMPELLSSWVQALTKTRRAMVPLEREASDPILASLTARLERLQEMRASLARGRTTAFVLVMNPERLPIEETARAADQLDAAGLHIGALIVNRVLPPDLSGDFYLARREQEQVYLAEIDRRFAKYPRLRVPQLPRDVYGLESLGRVSELLEGHQ